MSFAPPAANGGYLLALPTLLDPASFSPLASLEAKPSLTARVVATLVFATAALESPLFAKCVQFDGNYHFSSIPFCTYAW